MVSLAEYVGLISAGWLSYEWYRFRATLNKVEHIPTIGPDNFLGAYFAAWKFFIYGHQIIEEGYKKYPGGLFKVATFETASRWLIIGAGPQFADDIRKTNDEMVDIVEPAVETLQMDWTLGAGKDMRHRDADHHLMAVKGPMTRNLATRFADVQDEVEVSFKEFLPATKGWTSYPVQETLLHIVTRTTNRFFIGLPLCRNREYCTTMEKFAVKILLSAYAINLSPPFLRPIVARFTSNAEGTLKAMKIHLGPMIEERLKEDSDKPNDMVTWLIDCAPDHYRNVHDVVFRLLISNFAAIHTTTITLSDILFHLAAHHEYITPLRVELEEVVRTYGWTKEAMGRLHKLDSFMKEVARMSGVHSVAGTRKTKKDFTFSNGVTVPEGFTFSTASRAQHYDPALYKDPHSFDGNRFLVNKGDDLRSGFEQAKQQMVAIDTNYVLFGLGRHACPGRFLAVNESKAMAGYVLLNYDIKLADDSNVPPGGLFFGTTRSANMSARILFRKRQP